MIFKNLKELLISKKNSTKKIVFIDNSGTTNLTYKDLYFESKKVLKTFQDLNLLPGNEVVFQFEKNDEFIITYWACILGGLIPVPLHPAANDELRYKLVKVVKYLDNPYVVISEKIKTELISYISENNYSDIKKLIQDRFIDSDELFSQKDDAGEPVIHDVQEDDIAFIQFSSGSTSDPKGVVLTHKNLLTNIKAIQSNAKITAADKTLSWMPLTHDMGLIGFHLVPFHVDIDQVIMTTKYFIRNPLMWLQKAGDYKATLISSPNFGYSYFLDKFARSKNIDLDLSSIRLIFNGAEPISYEICKQFLTTLSEYGLKQNAMFPVYGLAEASLAVCFPPVEEEIVVRWLNRNKLGINQEVEFLDKDHHDSVGFIDEGYHVDNCEVKIMDDNCNKVNEKIVGHIYIKGNNVTSRYYNNETESKSKILDSGWLNTGDLGYIYNKRLVVTGRAKDIIFINGQNFYSHDLERLIESITGIKEREIVASGIASNSTNQDRLFLFIRFKKTTENFVELIKTIKRELILKIGIELDSAIPVAKIPATTSGKKMRFKLVKDYNNGDFSKIEKEVKQALAAKKTDTDARELNETETIILSKSKEIFNNEEIGIDDNLIDLGLNSLSLTNLTSVIEDLFSIKIQISSLFKIKSLRELARFIELSEKTELKKELDTAEERQYYQLGLQQRRIYILNQLEPESLAYNLPVIFEIKGSLDKNRLENAFQMAINKHETLRTSFRIMNDVPVQKINESCDFKIDYEVVHEDSDIQDLINKSIKPFNLNNAPLIRVKLFIKSIDEYLLFIDVHHIITDGVSLGLLVDDISKAYNTNELKPADFQYKDYTEWQQTEDCKNEIKQQEKYWTNQFSGEIPLLNLPADFPRPVKQSFEGKKILFNLDKKISDQIEAFCKDNNITYYMFFLAVYNIVLSRYSAQEEIIIGTPIANRSRNVHNEIFGLFMNTICLKNRPEANKKFIDFINEIKETSLNAMDNQNYPYEQIIENINIKRDLSRNPLFDTMFLYQNMKINKMELENTEINQINLDPGISKFDLSLTIFENNNNFEYEFEYCTKLFKEETIKRILESFKTAVINILSNPQSLISDINIISENEYNRLVLDFNSTDAEFPLDKKVIDLLEENAKLHPEKEAVFFKDKKLTYKQLTEKVNQAAKVLVKNGVAAEAKVGVMLNRSLEMIIALLAVMKSGGAYIPLDPEYPENRIKYILNDSSIKLLLTEQEYFNTFKNEKYILLDINNCFNEENNDIDLSKIVHNKNDLAYIIYTSGSTGNPKGVEIEHKALSNFLFSMKDTPGFTSADRLFSVTTLSFDISGLEFYLPLISGGQLFIASKDEAMTPDLLIKNIEDNEITIMQATPATWKLLIDCGWQGSKKLKALCGGEAMPPALSSKLVNKVSELWNMYGPTETTIWSSVDKIIPGQDITIGKPIANTDMYVLDRYLKPVPIGVAGELYIGGTGVARGYSNKKDLTNERFIDNPFKNNNEKIYKTGDLVFYRSDGKIEYLSRIDHQVKIRGFRIELGEIESVLQTHDEIKKCVVDSKLVNNEKSLIAYIQPAIDLANSKTVSDDSLVIQDETVISNINKTAIKNHLKEKLPDYMIPDFFIFLKDFPLTPNGKLDRKKLPLPEIAKTKAKAAIPVNTFEKKIFDLWKEVLGHDNITTNNNFFDIGGHSLKLAQLHNKMKREFNSDIALIDLFKLTTIQKQAEYFYKENNNIDNENPEQIIIEEAEDSSKSNDIAIIGISCRFPGAKNHREFWENLINGKDTISRFTDDELRKRGISEELLKNKNYVKAWGSINDIDKTDASFFGFTPREIEVIDPQQRVLLEECYLSLEDAGYSSEKHSLAIGLFAGVGMNTYINFSKKNNPEDLARNYQYMISNDKDFLSTRIAYKLNLSGPAVTVQTACSTSLVAVHLACESILKNECSMALAGGVSIRMPQDIGYIYQEGMILSQDGYCRAFDENASGTVGGNGAGIVVLKRLDQALKDNDNIYAVIKGSSLNNDGSAKIGYTAPSIEGQVNAIKKAYITSKIPVDTIDFIEAHGTGTKLGDPIEFEALNHVFTSMTDKKNYCRLGSVKTNVGHLDTAAGIAGLIKAALSIYHKKLPKTLYFEKPNEKIKLDNSPFFINKELSELKSDTSPLRAGISAFGIGGTNAHIILEQAPSLNVNNPKTNDSNLFLFSAKTEKSLKELLNVYKTQLPEIDESIENISYTLQAGRNEYEYRKAVVSDSIESLCKELENEKDISKVDNSFNKDIAFLFPGQGSQYVNMGAGLYQSEPVFRETVDKCCEILNKIIGFNFKDILFPDKNIEQAEKELVKTSNTQPALFVIEYAIAKYLMYLGIKPGIMIGHSIGEYVAAAISGVFTLEDALKIVVKRSSLMQSMKPGSMLAVFLDESEISKYLNKDIDIAAVNSPGITVLSGEKQKIDELKTLLNNNQIMFRDVRTSHAFHSKMMEPMLDEFKQFLDTFTLNFPKISFVSNLTGAIVDDTVTTSKYWCDHLRNAVRFSKGAGEILNKYNVLIEAGPGNTLTGLVKQQLNRNDKKILIPVIRHPKDNEPDIHVLQNAMRKLWLEGININWLKFNNNTGCKKVSLPVYCFEKQKYWLKQDNTVAETSINNRHEIKNWLYSPIWKQSKDIANADIQKITDKNILLFSNNTEISDKLLKKLSELNNRVIKITTGEVFNPNSNEIVMNPGIEEHYKNIFDYINTINYQPDLIIHTWNITDFENNLSELENRYKDYSFFSLLYLSKALYEKTSDKISILVLSNNMQNVTGDEIVNPYKSLIKGPVTVMDQEFARISCKSIDLGLKPNSDIDFYVSRIIDELEYSYDNQFTAYRGNTRWINDFEKIRVKDESLNQSVNIKDNGVYIITGGTGEIALHLVNDLSKIVNATFVLTSRRDFPDKTSWQTLLETGDKNTLNDKIKILTEIEKNGSKVSLIKTDVSNQGEVNALIDTCMQQFKKIDGVIHAAGVPGDGIIPFKTKDQAEAVLSPKVKGTIALYNALEDIRIDFLILFSSITSILGGIGQVDYCSANAFLDAFANCFSTRQKPIISINWDTWKEIGMAVNPAIKAGSTIETGFNNYKYHHPLVQEEKISDSEEQYLTSFTNDMWVLNEHWIMGNPVVPGTTYLEIAYSIVKNKDDQNNWIEFNNVYFMKPISLNKNEQYTAKTIITKNTDFNEFVTISSDNKTTHVQGKIRNVVKQKDIKHNIQDFIDKCNKEEILNPEEKAYLGKITRITGENESHEHDIVEFGPRWNNIKWIRLGENEGIAKIELDEKFKVDLDQYKIHPALLDCAVAFLRLFKYEGIFLPFSYAKLLIKNNLPGKFYSYIKLNEDEENKKGVLNFDIKLIDEDGIELIDITKFTMKEIDRNMMKQTKNPRLPNQANQSSNKNNYFMDFQSEQIENGIKNTEGTTVFKYITNSKLAQITVSTTEIFNKIKKYQDFRQKGFDFKTDNTNKIDPGNLYPRPDLENEYIPPKQEEEKKMAQLWQSILGIDKIGIQDDFFNLGGDSLLLVQLHKQLNEEFKTNISVVDLYKYTTIEALTKFITDGSEDDKLSVGEINSRINKKKEALKLKKKKNIRKTRRP